MKSLTQEELAKHFEAAGLYDVLCSIHESHEGDDCFCTTEIAPFYKQILAIFNSQLEAQLQAREANNRISEVDQAIGFKGKLLMHGDLIDCEKMGDTSHKDCVSSRLLVLRKRGLEKHLAELRKQVK